MIRNTAICIGLMLLCVLGGCNKAQGEQDLIILKGQANVIPKPVKMETSEGILTLTKDVRILTSERVPEEDATYMVYRLNMLTGWSVSTGKWTEGDDLNNAILLRLNPADSTTQREAYELEVNDKGVVLEAEHIDGLFYAMQSLNQLLPGEAAWYNNKGDIVDAVTIPFVKIEDAPRFKWRGLLLDCCRHFVSTHTIRKYIDLLALHKMNVLHWHLTEDQGWRIEIQKYPRLTSVGAYREAPSEEDYHSVQPMKVDPRRSHQREEVAEQVSKTSRYGDYYSQEDIRDIIAYAQSRRVTVVPEIEMPGHSVAALAAYPQYSCTGDTIKVQNEWGVFKDIYCAGNDSTFTFLEDVLTEVMDLFPSEYIHIGGDEAPKFRWENCVKCQKRMKEEGLKDEHELQSYFIKRINAFLESKGRKLIGWDEILEGGLAKGATVQSWRGMSGGLKAARSGNYAIMSPTSHAYFDYSLEAIDMEKVYEFEPIPSELEPNLHPFILGGECNMWTEHVEENELDWKVFPRLLAMSEVLWSDTTGRDYDEFYERVQVHYAQLDSRYVAYGAEKIPFTLTPLVDTVKRVVRMQFDVNVPEVTLHYEKSSNTPSYNSLLYSRPLRFDENTLITMGAFKKGNAYGRVQMYQFEEHLALTSRPTINVQPSDWYPGGGTFGLTDGIIGSKNFRDGHWQGYQYDDVVIELDLKKMTPLSNITVSCLQYSNAWIFLPQSVELEVAGENHIFVKSGTNTPENPPSQKGEFTEEIMIDLGTEARYVRVTLRNIKECPDWHDAAGGKAWIFVSEVMVR